MIGAYLGLLEILLLQEKRVGLKGLGAHGVADGVVDRIPNYYDIVSITILRYYVVIVDRVPN